MSLKLRGMCVPHWKQEILANAKVSERQFWPLEFHREVKRQKTRVMGLLCGESCMILTSTVLD